MHEHEEVFRKAREQDLRDHGMSDQPISVEGGGFIIPQVGELGPHVGTSATESFARWQKIFDEGGYVLGDIEAPSESE